MPDKKQKLGQYTLLEKIAQGGMAQVFKALTVDPSGFKRLVVIKRILPHISADPEYVEMLVDEAKIAVNFTHGNIAQIYDLGRVNDDYFIVMEYVDGKTLSQIRKRLTQIGQRFPLDILLYIFIELCRGLSYIHNKKDDHGHSMGVVHRDISPQNVILSYAGNIKVIDFGVAKAHNKEGQTQSGVLKGKFAYMSPEQSRGEGIDHRSDVFSAGTLLWEMATGERLFKKKTNQDTVQAVRKARFESAKELRSDLPEDFDKIVKKALQKAARNRYQDAMEMARDCEKLLIAVNPEFKPIQAAEFLFKLFGPEADEKALPNPLFEKEKTPVTAVHLNKPRANEDREDVTIREARDEVTPAFAIKERIKKRAWPWLTGFAIFLVGCFFIYQLIVGKVEKASVVFKGLPENARVFLNGEAAALDDSKIFLAPETQWQFRVQAPDYKDWEKTLVLKPMEERVLQIDLESKLAKTANLIISTIPPGATVYLNNTEWRFKTPVVIKNLPSNQIHKVGLFLEKFRFFSQEIKLEAGQDNRFEHHFVMNFAFLAITTNPMGANVTINGQSMGRTPFQNHLPPDEELELSVSKEGYQSVSEVILLKAGEERQLQFELKKLPDSE
ncbi:MAG: serine/threonine protein kinase [Deltaproteobacteria bacterium]|nr:serine/threonine protein kinase [Deltaproteobacteria bacterium]